MKEGVRERTRPPFFFPRPPHTHTHAHTHTHTHTPMTKTTTFSFMRVSIVRAPRGACAWGAVFRRPLGALRCGAPFLRRFFVCPRDENTLIFSPRCF